MDLDFFKVKLWLQKTGLLRAGIECIDSLEVVLSFGQNVVIVM